MATTRLNEYLDHQALVTKLDAVSDQCYRLLQLCNDLEQSLADHSVDPDAHIDIRRDIQIVSDRVTNTNAALNAYIADVRNEHATDVARLDSKDNDLTDDISALSGRLTDVESGDFVYIDSIQSDVSAKDILDAAKGAAIIQSTNTAGVVMVANIKSPEGVFTFGTNNHEFEVNYTSDTDIARNATTATASVILLDKDGNSKFGKNVIADKFAGNLVGNVTGNLTGNADTASDADKLDGLDSTDYVRSTGNVKQTITGTKTFSSKIIGDLQGTADNADKLDNLDSTDYVRSTGLVAQNITGNKTFTDNVLTDSLLPKTGNKYGSIGSSTQSFKEAYIETINAGTVNGKFVGDVVGNASTATTLQYVRQINKTNFNGSSAITTEIWGKTRNISISDAAGINVGITTGVNGSGDVVLKLPPTITASFTGNAETTSRLAKAVNINGTSFDGSANITTAQWGTARNIYISDSDATNTGTAVSVNGSGNVTLKLPATIKGTFTGNASTATTLQTARTINGTSFNGSANITTTRWGTARNISISDADSTNTGTAVSVNGGSNVVLKLPSTITTRAYPRRSDGNNINFYWSAQGGQPTYVWGGSDGTNMYVYSPLNFKVSAANQLQAFTGDDFTGGDHFIKAIRTSGSWGMRLYTCYDGGTKQSTEVSVGYADSAGSSTYASRSTNNGGFYISNYLVSIG